MKQETVEQLKRVNSSELEQLKPKLKFLIRSGKYEGEILKATWKMAMFSVNRTLETLKSIS